MTNYLDSDTAHKVFEIAYKSATLACMFGDAKEMNLTESGVIGLNIICNEINTLASEILDTLMPSIVGETKSEKD